MLVISMTTMKQTNVVMLLLLHAVGIFFREKRFFSVLLDLNCFHSRVGTENLCWTYCSNIQKKVQLGSQKVWTISNHYLGIFGMLKLATLILALKFNAIFSAASIYFSLLIKQNTY